MPDACSCLGATTSGVAWIDDACADAVGLAKLQRDGIAHVVVAQPSASEVDPVACWRSAIDRTLLWSAEGWLIASGIAAEITAAGPGRTIRLAAAAADRVARTIVRADATGGPALPLWLTAWTFAETATPAGTWGSALASATLRLPRRAWFRGADGRGWLIHARAVRRDEEAGAVAKDLLHGAVTATPRHPAAAWRGLTTDYADQVDDAVSLITDGVMRKVVLARAVDAPVASDDATILRRLREADPQATIYAHDLDDGGLFLGATPETLFTASGETLATMALAGTCPRSADDATDLAAVGELLASTKQRKEHGLVVEHLAAALRPRCLPFAIPAMPHRRDADRLIHLETLITAELKPGGNGLTGYLDLLGALHPTPAVCGLPTATAANYLARHEHLDRGLYSGALGWLTPDAAHLVVPLRGGVLSADRTRARLFAGAGIVETSDPQAELAETELKLGLMRSVVR